jgi:tRNA 2-thiouridine synthesizing protein A
MESDGFAPHVIVDTRGMFCPAPIIKLSEAIRNIDPGNVVELVSDDPAIESDLPAWCRSTGHIILDAFHNGGDYIYRVQKKDRRSPRGAG